MVTKENKIVPDTSVLINQTLTKMIEEGKIKEAQILIPRAVIDELQAQASRGKEIGFKGLEEIKKLRKMKDGEITIEFTGQRPTLEEIQLARKGRIDAIIRDAAAKSNGTLYTADYVQALVGEAEGVKINYIPQEYLKRVKLESFFDSKTQSVHLKVGVAPLAKKGPPGDVKLIKIRAKPCTSEELEGIISEIISRTRKDDDSFIEIGKQGALVIQMGKYRICIAKPPFSSGLEITAVRPIATVRLEDYKMHDELEKRVLNNAKGILIAGPPGAGKSSFAAAVAIRLSEMGNIVKTFEMPRDLQVGPEITQYGPLENDWEKSAELLLLVRPDYTIFDEIRKTRDFKIFGDMRLAGVGMIGVIHGTDPVSAIQRFVGRLELGIIPHVIDTVIYIKGGRIEKVYELSLLVKVPSGMKEADLARPVVEVRDFSTKTLEYEIYTFGEENVIMPMQKVTQSPLRDLAKGSIRNEIGKWDPHAEIEFLSDDRISVRIRNDVIPRIIGKGGKTIEELEKKLGIHISIEPKEGTLKRSMDFLIKESGAYINIKLKRDMIGDNVDILDGDEYILSAQVGNGGFVRIKKKSEIGRRIVSSLASGRLKIVK